MATGVPFAELKIDVSGDEAGIRDVEKKLDSSLTRMKSSIDRHMAGMSKKWGEFKDKAVGALKVVGVGITALIGIAGAGAAAITALAVSASEYGDSLDKARGRTGLYAQELSFLRAVAEDNDATFQDVVNGMRVFNKNIDELRSGNKAVVETFKELNITQEDYVRTGGDINKMLPLVLERMGQVENQSKLVNLAMGLFGKGGTALIPTIQALANDTGELRDKFEAMGLVVGDKFVRDAARLDDALDDTKHSIQGIKLTIGGELMPIVADVLEQWAAWIMGNRELVKVNVKDFVQGIAVAVDNIKIALVGVPNGVRNMKVEFSLMKTVMVGVNEVLIGTLKILNTLRTIRLGFDAFKLVDPQSLGTEGYANIKKDLEAQYENINDTTNQIAAMEKNLAKYKNAKDGVVDANKQVIKSEEDLYKWMEDNKDILGETGDELNDLELDLGGAGDKTDEAADAAKAFTEEIIAQKKALQEEIDTMGLSTLELIDYQEKQLLAEAAVHGLTAEIEKNIKAISAQKREIARGMVIEDLKTKVEEETKALQGQLDSLLESLDTELEAIKRKEQEQLRILEESRKKGLAIEGGYEEAKRRIREAADKSELEARRKMEIERLKSSDSFLDNMKGALAEAVDVVKNDTSFMSEFFGNVFANMSDTIAGFLDNAIRGKFDNMKDLWKNMLDSMLSAFIQFISAVTTRAVFNIIFPDVDDILGLGKSGGGGQGFPAGPWGSQGVPGNAGQAGFKIGDMTRGTGNLIKKIPGMDTVFKKVSDFLGDFADIIPIVGDIIAMVLSFLPMLLDMFKKPPRVDVEADLNLASGEAARLGDYLDRSKWNELIKVSVKRKAGLGVGGDSGIQKAIGEGVKATIESLQDIFRKLPGDIFDRVNEMLLNATFDMDTIVGGERFLEFDAKGKKVKEKWAAFINGELSAKVIMATRDTLGAIFEVLGVASDKAQAYMNQKLEEYKGAGSREARAEVGQEVLADINALVDAYNIANGTINDTLTNTLDRVKSITKSLGFETIPTMEEIKAKAKDMIENFEIDPETVAMVKELHDSIIDLTQGLSESIRGLVSQINALNDKIVSLGGTAEDVGYAIGQSYQSIIDLLNQGGLSLEERQGLLSEAEALVDAQIAEWQRANQAQNAGAIAAAQGRIDSLNSQKDAVQRAADEQERKIREVADVRLEQLNQELAAANALRQVYDSIRDNIRDLTLSSASPENAFQRMQRAQSEAESLISRARGATGEERASLAAQAQELLNQMLSIGGEAFQTPDPEYRAIFNETIRQLEQLGALVDSGRTQEQISAEIEAVNKRMEAEINALRSKTESQLAGIDSRIAQAQQEMTSLQSQNNDLTAEQKEWARKQYEYIRDELKKIMDERLKLLGELGIDANNVLTEDQNIMIEQLVTQRETRDKMAEMIDVLRNITGAQHGFEGVVTRPRLFAVAEGGRAERVSIHPVGQGGGGGDTYNLSFKIGSVNDEKHIEMLAQRVVEKVSHVKSLGRKLEKGIRQ